MFFADLTVIIPCYNSSNTIKRCLDSIVNQTLQPLKVIVVDDCSTDNTVEILNEYKRSDILFDIEIIVLKTNSGPAQARNFAWDKCCTKYIAFLDSDDAWNKDKIFYQYSFMTSNHQCVMSGHNFTIINSKLVKSVSFEKIFLKKMLIKNFFTTPSIMLKKDIIFRFDTNKRYCEDYKLWLEITSAYPNGVYYSDAKLVTLFKGNYGVSGLSSNLILMEKGELECFSYLYKNNIIGFFSWFFFTTVSILKFLKRVLFTCIRNFKNV